ncbi:MAG: ComF family protein [Actinomycetota bacterium]
MRLSDLLFPPRCLSCRVLSSGWLCSACAAAFPRIEACCDRCGRPSMRPVAGCAACCRARPPWRFARAAAVYEGPARDALMTFKLGGERRAAHGLAAAMVESSAGLSRTAVTFVPATRRAVAVRGFNPARELSRQVARALGVQCVGTLRKTRETRDQAGLGRLERRENLRGAFAAVARPPRSLLLVDDVMTTGATAAECARALLNAGVVEIDVLTFARAL